MISCASGEAVELASSCSSQSAFLIQPLYIPTGVTLQIAGGVIVFASRNHADYQRPGNGATATATLGTAGGVANIFVTPLEKGDARKPEHDLKIRFQWHEADKNLEKELRNQPIDLAKAPVNGINYLLCMETRSWKNADGSVSEPAPYTPTQRPRSGGGGGGFRGGNAGRPAGRRTGGGTRGR